MGISTYDGLMETIADFLARDDLDSQIATFVWLAECDIQRSIRFVDNEKVLRGTADGEYIQLPEDYMEGKYLRITDVSGNPEIVMTSPAFVNRLQAGTNNTSKPRAAFIHGSRLYFGRDLGDGKDYELFYKAGIVHLGKSNQSNRILQMYPDCLLYGALATSAPYLGDDARMGTWLTLYGNAKNETMLSESRARTGPGLLTMKSDRAG